MPASERTAEQPPQDRGNPKGNQRFADQLGGLLATICPPELLRLTEIRFFRGPTPEAAFASIMCAIETGAALPGTKAICNCLTTAYPNLTAAFEGIERSDDAASAAAIAHVTAGLAGFWQSQAVHLDLRSESKKAKQRVARIWVQYLDEAVGRQALTTALVAVAAAVQGRDPAPLVEHHLAMMRRLAKAVGPALDAALFITNARKRDIPFLRIGNSWAAWQFGWGARSAQIWTTASNEDGLVGYRIAQDKNLAKNFFRQLGVPTPDWRVVREDEDVKRIAAPIGWPCVVKPVSSGGGRGVTAAVNDGATLDHAAKVARGFGRHILVEAHLPGYDHRLMVVDGELIAAAKREPPIVTGDGKSSIAMLMDALNGPRLANPGRYLLHAVPADSALDVALASQNVTRQTILPKGTSVLLRTNANVSTGGTATDVLDIVHPQIREMAERLAAALGLRTTGLDYMTTDISRSHDDVGGGFIEANTSVGIDVLIMAGADPDMLCERLIGDVPARIPVTLLLASADAQPAVGKSLADQLAGGMALVSADTVRIGTLILPRLDANPVAHVETALRYPSVTSLVIMWSVEELCRHGLPLDKVDTVVLVDESPPAPWLAMLKRHSKKLVFADDRKDAIEASVDRAAEDLIAAMEE
jgi:cyanophycin synthetase